MTLLNKFQLGILLVLTSFSRLYSLGYSEFYGDETKALFVIKTTSLTDFLLNQRKGPLQFMATWVMENLTGGFSEFWMRLPFAIASILTVLVIYLIVKEYFSHNSALLAATLYSVQGFYIAFGRTVQYQSLYLLFGFISFYFAVLLVKNKLRPNFAYLGIGVFLALSYLSHYDAVFLDLLIGAFLLFNFDYLKNTFNQFLLWCVVPFLVLVGLFYVPYVFGGYFFEHTLGYLSRRVSGSIDSLPNNSFYTLSFYNPFYWPLYFLGIPLALYFKKLRESFFIKSLFITSLGAFCVFELIISNPGTHIHNYIFPLLIISGIALGQVLKFNKGLSLLVLAVFILPALIYVPSVYSNDKAFIDKYDSRYQLFVYGFPSYSGWEDIANVLDSERATSFYTNDNTTIARHYVNVNIPLKKPHPAELPEFFIYINKPQDVHNSWDENFESAQLILKNYSIYSDTSKSRYTIYKLN
jgi:hypothetical protein